jgi:hypothetical protein
MFQVCCTSWFKFSKLGPAWQTKGTIIMLPSKNDFKIPWHLHAIQIFCLKYLVKSTKEPDQIRFFTITPYQKGLYIENINIPRSSIVSYVSKWFKFSSS